MIIALIILSIISIILSLTLLLSCKRIWEQNNAIIVGLHEIIGHSQVLYMYQQYFLSSSKVSLEYIRMKSLDLMNLYAKNENFEEANFLKQYCDAIEQLKNMGPQEIEEYEE